MVPWGLSLLRQSLSLLSPCLDPLWGQIYGISPFGGLGMEIQPDTKYSEEEALDE